MAIVKGPAGSIIASGNVGQICYTTFRGLQIAKAAWSGTVPNTTKQIAQQVKLTTISQAWGGTLSPAERKTWHNLARSIVWQSRLGSPYIPSGYQLFMKWNIRRKVMGLTIMLTAPSSQTLVYVWRLLVLDSTVPGRTLAWLQEAEGVNIGGYGVEYYKAGPYDSGGRHPISGEWLFLRREVPPLHYYDYDVIAGKWYWYRGRQITEFGEVGNWFQDQVLFVS